MSSRRSRIENAWHRAWGDGDLAAFQALITPDYVRHSKTGSEGFDKLTLSIYASHEAFPDLKMTILNIVEQGQEAAIHWQSRGIHTGTFMGVPATDRQVIVSGASFLRFEGELLAEEWVVWDPRELLAGLNIWHLGLDAKA